jgi:immunoglobulin-like protein involved in spore germination/sporulation and spore germination protein
MKRLVCVVALGLLAAACQGKGGSLGSLPSPAKSSSSPPPTSPTPSPSPGATPTPSNRKVTFELWFLNHSKLFVTKRTVPFEPAVGKLALNALLEGPSQAEAAAEVKTLIPAGTQVLDVTIVKGVATVDLTAEFESGANARTMPRRLAEVIYTIGQYSTVRSVRFEIDGQSRTVVGGVPVQQPQTKKMYEGYLPAILVESPLIGSKVSSPVTVSGTANVFEATVSLRILDENGHEIARTFTTATCGTGCRGDYSVAVPFNVDHQQRGTIEVFESSAKDGSPINVVDIPVILTP